MPEPTTRGSQVGHQSHLSHDWLGLETFNSQALERLKSAVTRYHADLMANRNPRWLTLLGTTDTGKSHSAKALWREIKRALRWNPQSCEFCPRFVYWPNLVDQMRELKSFGEIRDMTRWPYLCIDEIGADRDPTGFAADKLHTLLGSRTGRWTIITGNSTLDAIEKMDARIASRMVRDGSEVVEINTTKFTDRKKSI